jgi:hypothetical protein
MLTIDPWKTKNGRQLILPFRTCPCLGKGTENNKLQIAASWSAIKLAASGRGVRVGAVAAFLVALGSTSLAVHAMPGDVTVEGWAPGQLLVCRMRKSARLSVLTVARPGESARAEYTLSIFRPTARRRLFRRDSHTIRI